MASTLSISTTIDHLIQRVGEVDVCQDHLKLIASSLTRLQQALNKTNVIMDSGRSYEEIERTLAAVDEIVGSFRGNGTNLNGMTHRDLESLLLRLQLRLTYHETDMTDDYQTKVQILSDAYQAQQILVQKVFDETMKQRLEIIEQRTQENIIKQLRILREKHADTIKSYLRGCTELHKNVPLPGLTGDIVAKVAQTIYRISSEDQIQLERRWQVSELPLARTFVQFKVDKSTSFERNESRRLLIGSESNMLPGSNSCKETSKGIWERLVSAPFMMSMIERDRYEQEEDVSEENIIRTKRWIVILGDPGSGKTSFARWLTRHLAQTLLLNGQHSTDYGPLRIPILIRIGEFAEMLKEQPSLTLFDYIGKHKWMGKVIVDDPSISPDDLSCALQDYIKHGQAFIILDGLDEIPVSDQRSLIINIVENFVDTYVQTPTGASAFDNPHMSRLLDNPSRSGGNQLIITSRIVGYHAAPLAGQFAHYTIRPMDMEHMKDFVDYWFFRVHQQILDTLGLSITNQGENHGEALKKELEKVENSGLLDVASNSCLMSFVCTVAFSRMEGSPLPTQRILLYESIVNSMLTLWSSKRPTIPIPDLIRILSDIATYIHGNSASGLIHEEKMKEICIQSIKASISKIILAEDDLQDIESQACEFVRIIREDVGILAARGESLYGFLHLTFQEYFTCLQLIDINQLKQKKPTHHQFCQENQLSLIAQLLRRHSNDPRFRVPIALALGKISSSWSSKDFDDFCYEFIQEKDESDAILPLGAFILIVSGNDLVNYPSNDIFFDALDRLIIAAGQHRWSIVCPFLFDQITSALRKLRHDVVALWIDTFLTKSPSHDIQTISALCHLLEGKPQEFENIKWLTQASGLMLQSLSTRDHENNQFAIDRLLVKVAFSNHRLLPVNPTNFKGFLLGEEIELNSIPVVLFPLIIILYGGLKREGQNVFIDPSHIHRESTAVTPILTRFLSIKDRAKQEQGFKRLKQECVKSFLARIENHDESCDTIDLCIATMCFFGIEYVQDNLTIISHSVWQMSMNRLKYVLLILRQFYFTGEENDRRIENELTKFISVAIEKFQYGGAARLQFLDLLDSLRSSVARLRSSKTSSLLEGISIPYQRVTLHLPNSLRMEDKFLNGLLSTDTRFPSERKSCSLLHHFTKLFWILEHNDEAETQYRMAVALDTIAEYLVFRNDEDLICSLTFVPSHLRNLYVRLLKQNVVMINSNDTTENDGFHLYFGHILTECLMLLSNSGCRRVSLLTALIALSPMLRVYHLENFGSSLLWTLAMNDYDFLAMYEFTRGRAINYETGEYIEKIEPNSYENEMTDEERRTLIRESIEQECQRLQNASTENVGKNMKLYSASVSLAHVCRWSEDERRSFLLDESVQGAMLITNRLTRLDALCVIALFSHSNSDQIQVRRGRSIQGEIEHQFNHIYPTLPLLLHAAIFIRCLPLLQHQQTIDQCLQNLFDKFAGNDQRDQQAVNEALSPYLQSDSAFSSVTKYGSHNLSNNSRTIHNKSSLLKKYFNIETDQNLSLSVLLSNLYLVELANDFYRCINADVRQLTIDESIVTQQFQFENSILTEAQALTITNILSSNRSSDQPEHSTKFLSILSDALYHFNSIEFRAHLLLETWMKWKDSDQFSSFAYHAALLLVNSDLWSVESTSIVCDLLCCENDRFRQRAEAILRSESDDGPRTSSKLGIDVILTLMKKRAHFRHTSPSGNLTLLRMFENTVLDIQSHLETILWLERYRIHATMNKPYSFTDSNLPLISRAVPYLPTDVTKDVSFCGNIKRISGDLIEYMCDLTASNFLSFLEIDGDTTSNTVLESFNQFVVSTLIFLCTLSYTDNNRELATIALMKLIETSDNDNINCAAAYTLGYVCNEKTYKSLFNQIQMAINNGNDTSNYSDHMLSAFISSYCHCISVNKIAFDQDDMDMFCGLLKHSSQDIFKAVRTGFGRVLKDKSFLFEMLGSDPIQCYHALINSTAYVLLYSVQEVSVNTTAEFIEEHPDLLPIFAVELYNSIHPLIDNVLPIKRTEYYFAYGYPRYLDVAASVAVRMPAAFCAFIKDWNDGDRLKRGLFKTMKGHDYIERAACLTILSIFGELTVELCEMFIEALRDDPYIQNTCHKCSTRIHSIKDEKSVLNLIFSYLKSKSMNVRYVAAKILLHLSKSSLIPFKQVQTLLNSVILDPDSNEGLWLIEEQDAIIAKCAYYYAGPLKDVIYSLLIQHLTGDASRALRRHELNDIDSDFVESEKASRVASCLYEAKPAGHVA